VSPRILLLVIACVAGAACSSAPPGAASASAPATGDAAAADAAWTAALTNADASAAAALDADFEWTNSQGRTFIRTEAIERLQTLAAGLRGETDVRHYGYGHVHAVTSARDDARMMRVWALRPEGWRVLGVIFTTVVTGETPFAATAPAAGDCENPCRTMPFTPVSGNASEIATVFMRLKMDEWHPDPSDWSEFVLDDVYYVTETAQLSKDDRVKRLASLEASGAASTPGDPVVSMRIHDFDDSAVMIARHTPFRGGDPYYSLRVWAFRDGRWQLANTQQTVIRSTPGSPAS
jgi:hypothetical protein